MKSTKSIAYLGIFVAITVIVGRFFTIKTTLVEVSFMFIPMGLAGYMFGPVFAGILGFIQDIINYILWPNGPFNFGFTLIAIISGIIYGLFLYKKELSFIRIFLVMTSIGIFMNVLVTTYLLQVMYNISFFGMLPIRIIKNLITIPLNTVIFYYVLKTLKEQKFIRKIAGF